MSKPAEPKSNSAETPQPYKPYDASKLNIVVAEDNLINLKILNNSLGDKFNVYPAVNGVIALNLVKALDAAGRKPAAIISDFDMPGGNGDQFLHDLRTWEQTSQKPPTNFIVQTAGNADKRTMFENNGAVFTEKPFKIDTIATEINTKGLQNPTISDDNKALLAEIATTAMIPPLKRKAPPRAVSAPIQAGAGATGSPSNQTPAEPMSRNVTAPPQQQSAQDQPASALQAPVPRQVPRLSPSPLPPVFEHIASQLADLGAPLLTSPPPMLVDTRTLPSPSPSPSPGMPLNSPPAIQLPEAAISRNASAPTGATGAAGSHAQRILNERNAPPAPPSPGHGGR